MNHSPLPWKIIHNCIVDANDFLIARHPTADAQFIVKAVNTHDALVKAMQDLLAPYADDELNDHWQLLQARKALDQAK